MGLPIVTTHCPGCVDVVTDGTNGLLVPIRDVPSLSRAIVTLLNAPTCVKRSGPPRAVRAVEQFDLSVIARQTDLLYRDLLGRKAL